MLHGLDSQHKFYCGLNGEYRLTLDEKNIMTQVGAYCAHACHYFFQVQLQPIFAIQNAISFMLTI